MMTNEVIVALISLLGVAITAGFTFMGARLRGSRQKLDQAEKEIDFQRAALGFSEFIEEWASISHEMEYLMASTTIDRILIFRAWNGAASPRWTTAVYQMREGDQEPISFIHFELDDDYQDRIRQIVGRKHIYFEVANIRDSAIKSIYMAEKVTASYWAYLHSFGMKNSDSKAILYMSFATHSDELISDDTKTRCNLLVSRLRGIAQEMHEPTLGSRH
jgi:hypothetical protein